MKRTLPKILLLHLCVLLFAFSLAGCSPAGDENQLPPSMPKDFNFVFNFGYDGKNQLDTINGKFTKDMIVDPSFTVDFELSDEEMNTIYNEMREINILSYPEDYTPICNVMHTPFDTYSIKIITGGREKNIHWADRYITSGEDSVRLRGLFGKIRQIIINKEEYKKLPQVRPGYGYD